MKLPAILMGAGIVLSLFVLTTNPFFEAVDHITSASDAEWEEETAVTNGRGASYDPVVAEDGSGNVHVVWTDERTGTPQLFYAKFDGSGSPVVPETRLTNLVSPSGKADMAVASDGTVTIVFVDGRDGTWNIFMKRLDQNGMEVTPSLQISQVPLGSTVKNIINNWGTDDGDIGDIGDIRDRDTPSADGGDEVLDSNVMQSTQTVLNVRDMDSFSPTVSVDWKGNAHIVWADGRAGNFELYYSKVSPSDEVTVSELRLTDTEESSLRPLTAIEEDGNLDLVWEEVDGDVTRVQYTRLGPYLTRTASTRLLSTTTTGFVKDLARGDDGTLHLVWSDEKSGSSQVRYMSFSPDGVTAWPETPVTMAGAECGQPDVAFENGVVHIAFIQGLTSSGRIYYRTIDLDTGNISLAVQLNPNAWSAKDLDLEWAETRIGEDGEVTGMLMLAWADLREEAEKGQGHHHDVFISLAETSHTVEVERSVVDSGNRTTSDPVAIAAAGGLMALGLAFATDIGKWATGAALLPLYSRLKRERLLDQSIRDDIYNKILEDPGVNFTGLMRSLKLKNGVLSYHLATLEREEYIVSRRDGIFRRYYPRNNGHKPPKELHEQIIDVIFEKPGITQSRLAKELSKSRQVINYHIKQLVANGTIKIERKGRQTKCFICNWVV